MRRLVLYGKSGANASTDFIIKVKTDNAGVSASNQFRLPTIAGTYNYDVDWGDDVIENITVSTLQTHTYPIAGTYTIKISGVFPRIYFNNAGDKSKLIEIVNFGDVGWTSMLSAFNGCNNMTIASTATGVMPSGSYINAWNGCSSLTSFPALDLSGGTSFTSAWNGCSSMVTFNATAMGSGSYYLAWYNCSSLTSFPALDLSGGTSFGDTWRGCSSMASFNATAMGSGTYTRSWQNCTSLTSFPALDLSGGNNFVSAWTHMGVMTSFATRQFYGMTTGTSCFFGTTLPTSDYSDILVTQRANNVNTDVPFHGGSSKYNPAGGTARGELVSLQSWSIIDAGAE